jgi:hypothetical protein
MKWITLIGQELAGEPGLGLAFLNVELYHSIVSSRCDQIR